MHRGAVSRPEKCPPPGVVLGAEVLHLGGVVGVAGPGRAAQGGVVPGAGVGVADDGREGRAAGAAVLQGRRGTRAHPPPFVAVDQAFCPGRPAAQKALKGVQVHRFSGGDALDGHADGRGMGLAEDGQIAGFRRSCCSWLSLLSAAESPPRTGGRIWPRTALPVTVTGPRQAQAATAAAMAMRWSFQGSAVPPSQPGPAADDQTGLLLLRLPAQSGQKGGGALQPVGLL